jgi:Fe-Mn family superoxide dismutase
MHNLPNLPYEKDALAPHISQETLEFHHGKHHMAYVTNLNNLLPGSGLEDDTLESVILKTAGDSSKVGIFNNAAQIWNHTFFWHSMTPNGGGLPQGRLLTLINDSFGSVDAFKTQFKQAATTQFGSGWAWLVQTGDKLAIVKTANAETPLTMDMTPLLTCDVWEHAYYLDFQNRRPDYVDTFLNHLINWEFAEKNLK